MTPTPPHDPEYEAPTADGLLAAAWAAAVRSALVTFVGACAGVLAALWVADRALAASGLPNAGTLRLLTWLLGAAAVGAAAAGVRQERRAARRIAERSAELERLSLELFNANRAKSEFLANVSHELRTPLNAVVGFAELLQEGVYGELAPRQVGPVQRIGASAVHLRHLVDQILDLARIAAGRLEVQSELVTLRPFVVDVAGEVEPLVHEKGLALSIAVPAGLPKVRSDPLHVRQVLLNLLGNAVKFTPSGGRVGVRGALVEAPPDRPPFPVAPTAAPAAALGGGDGVRAIAAAMQRFRGRRVAVEERPPVAWVALQVTDTGVGIAPDDRARVFDEFEQVGPRTGDGAERGTGLGLAISRRLARLLGGELTLESAVGVGSTFTLWLPVNPVDVPVARGADRPAVERRRGGRRRSDGGDAAGAEPPGAPTSPVPTGESPAVGPIGAS